VRLVSKTVDLQYITDQEGKRQFVILPIEEFHQLMEDLEDLTALVKRKDENVTSHAKFIEELRQDGLHKNQRTAEEQQQAREWELFKSFRDEIQKRELSNTENYDKAILTLSSTGLALSLSVIRFLTPEAPLNTNLLICSWYLFFFTIAGSLVAFILSNKALEKAQENAEEYYIEGNKKDFQTKSIYGKINELLNIVVGITFLAAVLTLTIFVQSNINHNNEVSNMNKKTNSIEMVLDSANTPRMTRISGQGETKSAGIPRMTQVPGSTQPPSSSNNNSTNTK